MTPFGALLRQWREVRRRSQLDLAGVAQVSARHVSFLESGRSQPSREMVLRLAEALEIPLLGQNELLEAAGFRAMWSAAASKADVDPVLDRVIALMMDKHEPYPLVVFDCHLDVVRANQGALRLFAAFLGGTLPPAPWNVLDLVFDERQLRPALADWEQVAHTTLALARRELHRRPNDEGLAMRVRALARAGLNVAPWTDPPAAFPVRLARNHLRASFVTTLTTFSIPLSVAADELRIESYFPLDEQTDALCRGSTPVLGRSSRSGSPGA